MTQFYFVYEIYFLSHEMNFVETKCNCVYKIHFLPYEMNFDETKCNCVYKIHSVPYEMNFAITNCNFVYEMGAKSVQRKIPSNLHHSVHKICFYSYEKQFVITQFKIYFVETKFILYHAKLFRTIRNKFCYNEMDCADERNFL